jgi:hypothetical protein
MRVLGWNVVLATWLLISAFLFTQTPLSTALTAIAAVLVALLSALSAGRPGTRYAIALVALALGFLALLLPEMSGAARVSAALTAALLFALALVSPLHRELREAPRSA